MAELRRRRDSSRADMVELRLDTVADLDVSGATQGRTRPVLLTCRATWEGGRFTGSEESRLRVLAQAIQSDAELVDVEWRADRRALPAIEPRRLVVSHHDFGGLPADVADRWSAMRSVAGPQSVTKLACTTSSLRDVLRLRAIAAADAGRHLVIGMGSEGLITRVCPDLFGSAWTFGGQAAPGQVPIEDLIDQYRVSQQGPGTRRFAIAGKPLGHSASPAMHNAAFAAEGVDAVYLALESDDAQAVLDVMAAFGFEGASVTAPLKTRWSELGVALDDEASAIGAANTLRRAGSSWAGRNFDLAGFLSPLAERTIELRERRCVVLGSGGAARAAAWALTRAGARVEISARRQDAASDLARELGATAGAWPPAPGWDLLVNATPVGTSPDVDAAPIPRALVHGRAVYDLIYHPRETTLLRWAREAGIATIGGLGMLVAQAAHQFEYWIGRPAPVVVMRQAAEQFIDKVHTHEANNV